MRIFRTFFRTLYKSCTSTSYYVDVVKAKFSFTLKFFYMYIVLLAFMATILAVPLWYSPINKFLSALPNAIVSLYPKDLVITVSGGKVSTNVDEPYFIPLETLQTPLDALGIDSTIPAQDTYQNLLVVDTLAKIDDIYSYKTYALLTLDHLVYIKDRGTIEALPLNEVTNLTIDQSGVESAVQSIAPFLHIAFPLFCVSLFIGFLLYGSLILSGLLFFTILLYIVARLMSIHLSYVKLLQIGIHMSLVPKTILLLLGIVGINVSFPYRDTILLLALGILILYKNKQAFIEFSKPKVKPAVQTSPPTLPRGNY